MNIKLKVDDLSAGRLEAALGQRPGEFKLFFDTEGCGCNGVIAVLIINGPEPTDLKVQAEPYSFYVDRQQASLFDEDMRLEAFPDYPAFKLVSNSGVLGSNIRFKDIR
ncbi:iron-sulfur cluster biosynthesis family protein [Paenibacillus sp. M1]|uniref:Iron-sulfur cluster biosynthesis family protein n=1 Tax=Paenibacillus haidiansis TaxID=1574488 RepID=A0ABU7VLI4_9BACL